MTSKQRGWKEVPIAGVCWIPATEYVTGDWRIFRPILDPTKCNKCLMCYLFKLDPENPRNHGAAGPIRLLL